MSGRTVLKRERAKRDLLEHALFIAKDQPAAAERLLDEAERAFELLAALPQMAPLYGFSAADLADLRFWPIRRFENFLVFYRPIADGIEVVRVLHGARDVEAALRFG